MCQKLPIWLNKFVHIFQRGIIKQIYTLNIIGLSAERSGELFILLTHFPSSSCQDLSLNGIEISQQTLDAQCCNEATSNSWVLRPFYLGQNESAATCQSSYMTPSPWLLGTLKNYEVVSMCVCVCARTFSCICIDALVYCLWEEIKSGS